MSKETSSSLFFYQGDKLITVKRGDQHHTLFRNDSLPLAEQQTGISRSCDLLLTDDKGSVLSVQDADEEETHAFTAYGHDPGYPSRRTLLGFNGEQMALLSKTYPLGKGYRNYSPRIMRFNTSDALSPFSAGGLNVYAYCLGDPVNRTDPSGRISFKLLVKRVIFLNKLKAMRVKTTRTNGEIIALPSSSETHKTLGEKPTLRVIPQERSAVLPEDAATAPTSALSQRSRSSSTTSYDSDSSALDITSEESINNVPYHVRVTRRSTRNGDHQYHDPSAPR
jgi:RHS repeat-associated protein